MPKGYIMPRQEPRPPVLEKVLMGCRHCYETWQEEMMVSPDSPSINGARLIYDRCSECKDEPSLLAGLDFIEHVIVTPEEFQKVQDLIDNPPPTKALKELMSKASKLFKS